MQRRSQESCPPYAKNLVCRKFLEQEIESKAIHTKFPQRWSIIEIFCNLTLVKQTCISIIYNFYTTADDKQVQEIYPLQISELLSTAPSLAI